MRRGTGALSERLGVKSVHLVPEDIVPFESGDVACTVGFDAATYRSMPMLPPR